MFNQRGQAFSVFELMIAAIVAVAILFVLLPILSGIGGGNTVGAAKDAISNGLSSVKGGGSLTTQTFTLKKDDLLTSKSFSDKGFDQHSILFAIDSRLENSFVDTGIKGSDPDDYSSFHYTGSTSLTVSARIICELTGTSLDDTLANDVDPSSYLTEGDGETLCGPDGDYQPCCMVILKRA